MSEVVDKTKAPVKKWPWQIKFLLIVVALYILIGLFNKYLIIEAVFDTVVLLYKIIPILVLVFIIMLAINMFLEPAKIKKYIGQEAGAKGWFYASIAGILISGPPYILYPMLGELKKSGMANSLLAVFLYNRNIKIPFIPIMIFYFGLAYTIIVSILIIVFSLLNGLLIKRFVRD